MAFHKGKIVVRKTSLVGHRPVQNSPVIKADRGTVGLTDDPGALRRWMVDGTEVTRLVAAYEVLSGGKDAAIGRHHHEHTFNSAHMLFLDKVETLFAIFKDVGNLFQEDSEDLLALDTRNIADPALAEMVHSHYQKGQGKFHSFVRSLWNEAGE